MEYNTQRKKMELPEYGRSVQNMVDHALTIEDKVERQRCANTIVNIMGGMFPHLRDVPDFKHKLWDHLAIMADFKLDIDYPQGNIRYRHYGRILAELIKKAMDIKNENERKQFIRLLAIQMKKSFINWNKEGIEDQKIVDDLREYSNGLIDLKVEDLELNNVRMGGNNNNQRKSNNQRKQNNQRKKY